MLIITEAALASFRTYLTGLGYSSNTIARYLHDARLLMAYAPDGIADRTQLAGFHAYLEEKGYCPVSINSMLGAVNLLLKQLGSSWRLRYCRVQRAPFLPPDRELSRDDYERMVRAAERQGDKRLALLTQTLCALGLRVSELAAVTVESLGASETSIRGKGKHRAILIPGELAEKLSAYCAERGIAVSGAARSHLACWNKCGFTGLNCRSWSSVISGQSSSKTMGRFAASRMR